MIARLADRVRTVLAVLAPLGDGSRALLLRLVERFGWRAVGAGAAVVVYTVARHRTWFVWMLLGWCAFAWMHAPDETRSEPGEQPPGVPVEEPEETADDPLPGILWELIGDAPGVHVNTVVEHLHETGLDAACDRAAVRAALNRRGIPVRPSVREADGRVNQGVHREDLEAWEQALSPTPAVSLVKGRSEPATTALTSAVAAAATAVATPATPPKVPES